MDLIGREGTWGEKKVRDTTGLCVEGAGLAGWAGVRKASLGYCSEGLRRAAGLEDSREPPRGLRDTD